MRQVPACVKVPACAQADETAVATHAENRKGLISMG